MFLQNLFLQFKNLYVKRLKSFEIDVDPNKIDKTFIESLPGYYETHFNGKIESYNNTVIYLEEEVDILTCEIEEENLSELVKKINRKRLTLLKKQVRDFKIRKTILCIIKFKDQVTINQARRRIKSLGFETPDIFETTAFVSALPKDDENIIFPIIAVDAYTDTEKAFSENVRKYVLCIMKDSGEVTVVRPGEAEFSEVIGARYVKNTGFLVKEIKYE